MKENNNNKQKDHAFSKLEILKLEQVIQKDQNLLENRFS